ncbi:MAG: TlpA family protein disulfide reductase [Bacteroidia bacterium]|nr:TlpA family protein disulfide reductase [Bacteroidia bacterium]MDW8235097.1 TlpA disulfide reductase family protein [Bacteroidia bacterium]
MLWIGVWLQALPAVRWEGWQQQLSQSPDTYHVINFWATWCRPCVKELPFLEQAYQQLREKVPVRFWLISVDSPPQGSRQAARLLAQRGITLPALWLAEHDPNVWIPQVSSTWDGALPYTHIYPLGVGHMGGFESAQEVVAFIVNAIHEAKGRPSAAPDSVRRR